MGWLGEGDSFPGCDSPLSRRAFLRASASVCATMAAHGHAQMFSPTPTNTAALKQAARESGKILGCFTGMNQLLHEPTGAAMIADTFQMIAVGNDLKFTNRLRPTPDTFDFSYGDADIEWATTHKLLFRAHCLIWWNALPAWFHSYVTAANAHQVMTDHITTVVKHYAGRVYSWDVVNEAIYHDNRPDGQRKKPWLELVGDDYIDIAFHTAAAADPKAKLILNECFIEHDTPAEILRRDQLLRLATRLTKAGVPITGIGVQGHLRGATPLDRTGLTTFLKQLKDLGLEVLITELDVDSISIPPAQIDQNTAAKYAEFLDIMMPYVKVVTFESLTDVAPGVRVDNGYTRPNIFDDKYRPKPAFDAVVQALRRPGLPAGRGRA